MTLKAKLVAIKFRNYWEKQKQKQTCKTQKRWGLLEPAWNWVMSVSCSGSRALPCAYICRLFVGRSSHSWCLCASSDVTRGGEMYIVRLFCCEAQPAWAVTPWLHYWCLFLGRSRLDATAKLLPCPSSQVTFKPPVMAVNRFCFWCASVSCTFSVICILFSSTAAAAPAANGVDKTRSPISETTPIDNTAPCGCVHASE